MHYKGKPSRPLSEPLVGILQETSPTLRKFTVKVDGLQKPTTIGNQSVYKIHKLDKVLNPTRFPYLQECEFQIWPEFSQAGWPKCVDSARGALKSLHARNLLKITQS